MLDFDSIISVSMSLFEVLPQHPSLQHLCWCYCSSLLISRTFLGSRASSFPILYVQHHQDIEKLRAHLVWQSKTDIFRIYIYIHIYIPRQQSPLLLCGEKNIWLCLVHKSAEVRKPPFSIYDSRLNWLCPAALVGNTEFNLSEFSGA